jgi:hypothetical protein
MSWYESGFDGMAKEQARQETKYGPQRLYVKAGTSRDLVFVDDTPACIYEHNPKINGNWRNWMTCLQGVEDDVVCCQKLGLDSRYYCGYLTIVDCTSWTDDKGKTHQYGIKLAQGKMKTLKRWKRKKDDKGALAGQLYRSTREDKMSPSVGDEWEFQREADMAKLFEITNYKGKTLPELWGAAEADEAAMERLMRTFSIEPGEDGKLPRAIPPFNYYELLKPKAPGDLRMMLGAVQAEDNDDRSVFSDKPKQGQSTSEDQVPF